MQPIELDKAAVVERLRPHFIIENAQWLEGGLSNRCMKLSGSDGREFVWRPNGQPTKIFGLSRQNEHDALLIASQMGLTSRPVALYPEGLLNEWVKGDVLVSAELDMLAELQAKVHELPALTNRFDPFEKGQHYFRCLSSDSLTHDVVSIHQYFQRSAFKSDLTLTTSHYDLGAYNLIRQPNGEVKVIDWEYAALGDPALDLVMTSIANDVDLETLVNRYCQKRRIENVELWHKTCERWLPVAHYLGLLWFLLGFELYGLPLYQERAFQLLADLNKQRYP
ncbi:phosphotransferase [Enterovibrio makurazakiensis]|uniref:Phosphotransferase n=1 Tax=Enterovibrio gelatinilyticus TaxID=2899819 RepID=A0ABT5R3D2_9GAMM|nr:phosphotransferase [Enterovibrio sp. ZSDZ42]MDD1794777.1 phosphotransferase [Enterovibrio sp. ZSDZ42]